MKEVEITPEHLCEMLALELKEAVTLIKRIGIVTDKQNTDINDLFRTISLVNCTVNDYLRRRG